MPMISWALGSTWKGTYYMVDMDYMEVEIDIPEERIDKGKWK